jgi:hypothetical protein
VTDPIAIRARRSRAYRKAVARTARNAALRDAAAKIREMPWWRVNRSWTDRQGKAWPMVEALTQDDYANAILAMIE